MKSYTLTIQGIPIVVCHKKVKNLNLRIYPPNGEVRLSAPLDLSQQVVHCFLSDKIDWIRRKQAEMRRAAQAQESALQFRDEIDIFGKKIRFKQSERNGRTSSRKINPELIEITVAKGSSAADLAYLIEQVAIETLEGKIPPLIERWQKVIGVQVKEWRLRKVKTRWGSCNPMARRIWLNSELVKKPPECLEYVIVHEMIHLLERRHNATFYRLMDRYLPDWRERRARLRGK